METHIYFSSFTCPLVTKVLRYQSVLVIYIHTTLLCTKTAHTTSLMFNFQSREAIISKVSNVGVIGVIKAQREVFIGFYPAQHFTKEISVQFHKV